MDSNELILLAHLRLEEDRLAGRTWQVTAGPDGWTCANVNEEAIPLPGWQWSDKGISETWPTFPQAVAHALAKA